MLASEPEKVNSLRLYVCSVGVKLTVVCDCSVSAGAGIFNSFLVTRSLDSWLVPISNSSILFDNCDIPYI